MPSSLSSTTGARSHSFKGGLTREAQRGRDVREPSGRLLTCMFLGALPPDPWGGFAGSHLGEAGGRPYRVPVKQENTLSEPKYLRREKVHGRSVFFCCLLFCSVTSTYRNVLAPSSFFAPACSLWIHSSSPPAAGRRLFRAVIHPDLSRAPRIENPRTRPHPDSVGTRTTSVPHPVQSWVPPTGETGHTWGLVGSDPTVKPF
jgi:hypothetical protein